MKIIKYPRELKSIITESGGKEKVYHTLSLTQHLDACDDSTVIDTDKENQTERVQDPLKIFTPWSVFKIALIEKKSSSQKRSVFANIPVNKIAVIERRTACCSQRIVEEEIKGMPQPSAADTNMPSSLAYTQKLAVGNYQNRGKTPAQILMNNPDGRKNLMETANWLHKNMDRHEGNRKQFDAIREAIELFDAGKLTSISTKDSSCADITVYSAPVRTLSQKNKNNKNLVYDLRVTCNPQRNYPYTIRITNYYAECKGILPVTGTIENKQDISMSLSESDWEDIVDCMRMMKNLYVQVYGPSELNRAMKAEEAARNEARGRN